MNRSQQGAALAVVAYGTWGVVAIYFKWLAAVAPTELLVHRIVWSLVLLAAIVMLTGRDGALRRVLESRALAAKLAFSGVLLAINWLVFIWAIQNGRMVETSLGYFINPLFTLLLGIVFLHERIDRLQTVAVVIAGVGVANEVLNVGVFPWVGLTLALTFGVYGLVRKKAAVDSLVGLGVETLLLAPLALVWFGVLVARGEQSFGTQGLAIDVGLMCAGVVTSVPLVCFAAAANRLPLSVLGLFQYLSPTITLLLAVLVYDEPFRTSQFITFGCIWAGLVLFSGAALVRERPVQGQAAA